MKNVAIGFIFGLLVAAGYAAWHSIHHLESDIVIPSKDLSGVPTTLETMPVKVYPRTVNNKLGVPASSKVLAATKSGNKTITASIDDIGETTIYVRKDPLPWFSRDKSVAFGIAAGFRDGISVIRTDFEYDFMQLKAVHFGPLVSIDTNGHGETKWFVGVGLTSRW